MEQPGNQTCWSYLAARTKSQRPKNSLQSDTLPIQNFPRVIGANSRTEKKSGTALNISSQPFLILSCQTCAIMFVFCGDVY